jgi:hypothetical protein
MLEYDLAVVRILWGTAIAFALAAITMVDSGRKKTPSRAMGYSGRISGGGARLAVGCGKMARLEGCGRKHHRQQNRPQLIRDSNILPANSRFWASFKMVWARQNAPIYQPS